MARLLNSRPNIVHFLLHQQKPRGQFFYVTILVIIMTPVSARPKFVTVREITYFTSCLNLLWRKAWHEKLL